MEVKDSRTVDLAKLLAEAHGAKKAGSEMPLATNPATWSVIRSLMHDTWSQIDQSQNTESIVVIKDLVFYCRNAFTKGQTVQNMAYDAGLLDYINRFAAYDENATYAALSNMVTKNRKLCIPITRTFPELEKCRPVEAASVPIPLFILIRNTVASIAGHEGEGIVLYHPGRLN